MKHVLLILFTLVFTSQAFSQATYTVSWDSTSYDTLANAYSILNDVGLPMSGEEYEVVFGFDFPFYDSLYSSVIMDADGYGYFPTTPGYNLYMYAAEWEAHQLGYQPIVSDWRYRSDTVGGLSVAKLEWRNVGIPDDVWNGGTDHRVNYQLWFFEDGAIELHFGEMDLANSPNYSDSTGYSWIGGGINGTYGPWTGISNNDYSQVYYVSGIPTAPEVIVYDDSANIYFGTPYEGHFVRWELSAIASQELSREVSKVKIYPNPTSGDFSVSFPSLGPQATRLQVFAGDGQLVQSHSLTRLTSQLSLSGLPAGMYYLRIGNEGEAVITQKVLKR